MILASTSPRRRELLHQAGFSFTTLDPGYDEQLHPNLSAHDLVKHLAQRKCEAAAEILGPSPKRPELIVSSDTVVALGKTILEKPADHADAANMLSKLSANTHTVYTGVCLGFFGAYQSFVSATHVTFRTLTPEFIAWYLSCNEYVDKAGAYAIQGIGRLCVASFEGDYDTVVGFPTAQFYETLQSLAQLCSSEQQPIIERNTPLPLVTSLGQQQRLLLKHELTRIHPSIGSLL